MTYRSKGRLRHSWFLQPPQKIPQVYCGIVRGLRIMENTAVGVLMGIICATTAAQVLFRFVLKTPLAWSDEMATFSFVWLALLGAAIGVREKAHIGVDAVVRLFPSDLRTVIALGSLILLQLFLGCLVKFGIDLVMRIGDQRSAGLQIKIFWVYLSLPVSIILMLLHSLPETYKFLAQLGKGSSERLGG